MSTDTSPLYFNESTLRNDLDGDLQGSVLFAQCAVLPSRASRLNGDVHPRLAGLRDTLALFKPLAAVGTGVTLKVMSAGSVLFETAMATPEQLPPVTERESDPEYGRIAYGENFWSAIIPARYLLPRIDIELSSDASTGIYRTVDVGAPTELLLNAIDIGMLTPHRGRFSEAFGADLVRQYWQTSPCSRLTVNIYEPVHFQFIELANGTLYTERSADTGTVHAGDLRQRIGKELISLGINNASYGIHCSPGSGENGLNKHFVTAQLTAHTSVGNYANGRVIHGLSGGGSMVTLNKITGNEFSHELGHNYGLGHYPNGFAGSVHRAATARNSAWGWDSDAGVFIPNFAKHRTGAETCEGQDCEPPFHDHAFGRDAMAGGGPQYPATNQYTQHTPWVLESIQSFLEGKAVFSDQSASGYLKWDGVARVMAEWGDCHSAGPDELDLKSMTALLGKYQRVDVGLHEERWADGIHLPEAIAGNKAKGVHIVHDAPQDSVVHVNGSTITLKRGSVLSYESDGTRWNEVRHFSVNVARRPALQGVPTTTVLGFYDPEAKRGGAVYPALHCAYGMNYAADREVEVSRARCHALITNARNEQLAFVLAAERLNADELNRFHINVPQSFAPVFIQIYCDGTQNASRGIDPPAGTAQVHRTGGI